MPKNDNEKEALLTLVLRYEACYEAVKQTIDESNNSRDNAMVLLATVLDLLDDTFGTKETADAKV